MECILGSCLPHNFQKLEGTVPTGSKVGGGDASHGSHRVVAPMGFGIEKYLLIIVVNPLERERTRVPKARIKFNYYRK